MASDVSSALDEFGAFVSERLVESGELRSK